MRTLTLLLLLGVAACEAPTGEPLRLATFEQPGSLGLRLRELPAPRLESLGLPYGLAVVQASGLAAQAGLRVGDVIYGVNRWPIRSLEDFGRLLAEHDGGSVGLLVRRGSGDFYVPVAPEGDGPGAPPRDTLLRT